MTARLGSAFVPVSDTARSATWYADVFGVRVESIDAQSAVLSDADGRRLTLLSPLSGIQAVPGLSWASCSFLVDDVTDFQERCSGQGRAAEPVGGDPDVCLFFTLRDPDGNAVLVVDR